MYIYNISTYTIYISTWTRSCVTAPLRPVQNNHRATLGVMSDLVFIKQRHYSTEATCRVTTKASGDFLKQVAISSVGNAFLTTSDSFGFFERF